MSFDLYHAKSLGLWLTRFNSVVNEPVDNFQIANQIISQKPTKKTNTIKKESIFSYFVNSSDINLINGRVNIINATETKKPYKRQLRALSDSVEKHQNYIVLFSQTHKLAKFRSPKHDSSFENLLLNEIPSWKFHKVNVKTQSVNKIFQSGTSSYNPKFYYSKAKKPSWILNSSQLPKPGLIPRTQNTFDWYTERFNPVHVTSRGKLINNSKYNLSNDRGLARSNWLSSQSIYSYGCWLGLSSFWSLQDEVVNDAVLELIGCSEQEILQFKTLSIEAKNFGKLKLILQDRVERLELPQTDTVFHDLAFTIAVFKFEEKGGKWTNTFQNQNLSTLKLPKEKLLMRSSKELTPAAMSNSVFVKKQLDLFVNYPKTLIQQANKRGVLLRYLQKLDFQKKQTLTRSLYGLPYALIQRLELLSANFDFNPYRFDVPKSSILNRRAQVQNSLYGIHSINNLSNKPKWPSYFGNQKISYLPGKITNPYQLAHQFSYVSPPRMAMSSPTFEPSHSRGLVHSQFTGLNVKGLFNKKGQQVNLTGNHCFYINFNQLPALAIWCHAVWVFGLLTVSVTFSPFLQRRKNSRISILGGKNYSDSNQDWFESLNLPAGYKNRLLVNKIQRIASTLKKFIGGSYSLIPISLFHPNEIEPHLRFDYLEKCLTANNRDVVLKLITSLRVLYRSKNPFGPKMLTPKGLLIVTPNNDLGLTFAKVVAAEAKIALIQINPRFQDASPVAQLELLAWYGKVYSRTNAPCVVFVQNVDVYGLRSMPSISLTRFKCFNYNNYNEITKFDIKSVKQRQINLVKPYKPWAQQSRKLVSQLYNRPTDNKAIEADSSVNVTYSPSYGIAWDNTLSQVTQLQTTLGTGSGWINPNLIRKDDFINRMLAVLDGVSRSASIHVFATASSFSNIDPALTRYGRLSEVVFIKPRQQVQSMRWKPLNSLFSPLTSPVQHYRSQIREIKNRFYQYPVNNRIMGQWFVKHFNMYIISLYTSMVCCLVAESTVPLILYKDSKNYLKQRFGLQFVASAFQNNYQSKQNLSFSVGNTAHGYDSGPNTPLVVALERIISFQKITRIELIYKLGSHWVIPAWWHMQTQESAECLPHYWVPCLTEPSLKMSLGQDSLPAHMGMPRGFCQKVQK
uniref:Cell division protein n=1 Tax=Chloroparvula japonica TaxID=1411623 RepID=A0A4D6C403_9CHLO|nr:cell division protein [Chloroparvula japonica]QBX98107.1 cell division protein [Chloroparvula japonica]